MNIKAVIAAASLALAPVASSAATTINSLPFGATGAGPTISDTNPIGSVMFTNNTGVSLLVGGSASGSSTCVSCLSATLFGLSLTEDDPTVNLVFTSFTGQSGSGLLTPLEVGSGADFWLVYQSSGSFGDNDVPTTWQISATVIPLPAAGWLLLTALGGLAVAARRRKAAA